MMTHSKPFSSVSPEQVSEIAAGCERAGTNTHQTPQPETVLAATFLMIVMLESKHTDQFITFEGLSHENKSHQTLSCHMSKTPITARTRDPAEKLWKHKEGQDILNFLETLWKQIQTDHPTEDPMKVTSRWCVYMLAEHMTTQNIHLRAEIAEGHRLEIKINRQNPEDPNQNIV